jgi:hypothetical protein
MRGPTYGKLCNDDRHNLQNLSISSIWYIAVVVKENGFKKSWNNVVSDHLEIISFLNIRLDKLQDLLFDSS